ncbi:MAG: hypothetical protein A2086_06965 [Spirochaetes bacterium GWD1_27_9]|nr:MAG: hypothetical protein A2Z98_00835 [Spirochaetes bacterium GWB1_27_13]OHD22444.1 MAG: hypothetical protein A2Y34_05300 [Spirochaetes bacterium GWC1_27_15]OHD29350.1 MAG: hypothetical protein A2086_06965 [Spirochaetes bacterium GWD1_27_9]
MRRDSKITEIQDLVKIAFNNTYYRSSLKVLLIKRKWIDIIGKKLFFHTSPEKMYNGILYVNCSHQGWIQTLQFYKNEIIENIQKYYNDIQVKEIIFKLGKIDNQQSVFQPKEKKEEKNITKTDETKEGLYKSLNIFFDLCRNRKTNT